MGWVVSVKKKVLASFPHMYQLAHMSQSGDRKDRDDGPPPAPGRLQAAWRALRGEAVVPDQIRAEWAEYQLMFGDLLQRWSSMLARDAKLEKQRRERLEKEIGPLSRPEAVAQPTSKAQLRSIAAQRFGIGPYRHAGPQHQLKLNGKEDHESSH